MFRTALAGGWGEVPATGDFASGAGTVCADSEEDVGTSFAGETVWGCAGTGAAGIVEAGAVTFDAGWGATGTALAGAGAAASAGAGGVSSSWPNEEKSFTVEGSSSLPDQKAVTLGSGTTNARTMWGVIARTISVLSFLTSWPEKSEPINGMSPNSDIFWLLLLLESWMSPPIILVSPSLRLNTVSRLRVPIVTTVVAEPLPPIVC